MVKMLLGLDTMPKPHDATDALAVAICHLHNGWLAAKVAATAKPSSRGALPAMTKLERRWRRLSGPVAQ